jgi:hypothetical protein
VDAYARRRVVFAALVVVLLALHLLPPHRGAAPMIAGFLPWDLAYAVLWMLAAAGAVLYLTDRVWPGDGDAPP